MIEPTLVEHRHLGFALVTEACLHMQANNDDPTSMFIEHDRELREVTKVMVIWLPRHIQEHTKHCAECQAASALCPTGRKLVADAQVVAARIAALPKL